jgi:chromosome partitioning protein
MEVIAIANEKGGVAKTTTAISLGGALVEQGKEVLLVDLDAQANLTLGLGIASAKLRRSIADVFISSASLLSVSRESGIKGLDIVPSSASMGMSERILPMRNGHENVLKTALDSVTSYDYIILDCPPSLGAVTLNALIAAHRVITPTQPEYFSVYGLRSIMNLIKKVRGAEAQPKDSSNPMVPNPPHANSGESEDITQIMPPRATAPKSQLQGTNPNMSYHILITMMDRRNRIHKTLKEQLKQTFPDNLFETVIEIDTKLRESTVMGQPISLYSPRTRGAIQYQALAEEIQKYAQEKAAEQN